MIITVVPISNQHVGMNLTQEIIINKFIQTRVMAGIYNFLLLIYSFTHKSTADHFTPPPSCLSDKGQGLERGLFTLLTVKS